MAHRPSACRTSSTRFSKMQAFSRGEAACCSSLRRRKLRIVCPAAGGRAHSLRCSSSPNRDRFAESRSGPRLLARLQAEKAKFRGTCPRNFGNLTFFRRQHIGKEKWIAAYGLRTAKLCRGLFPMQGNILFLHAYILFRQTDPPRRSDVRAGFFIGSRRQAAK